MTHTDFNQLLSSINGLTPQQMRRVIREMEIRLATAGKHSASAKAAKPDAGETAYDVASRAGLIGCIQGTPRSPTDLSTNEKHMEGFGHD